MNKAIYALIVPLVVAGGLVYANRDVRREATEQPAPKPPTAAERAAALKQWEATPDGMKFTAWESSPAGRKVYAAEARIRKQLSGYSDMEAVITDLALPLGARLGFGVMVRIDGADYILTFPAAPEQMKQLQSLRVNDRIIVRSRNVSHAPKYAYPIVSADYVEREGKMLFKRIPRPGGC
ncbi:hypothetical protein [Flaviaesturariibacter amylovorans]|uniref:Uncharacterized protein n=1 Tax=Flaviaesturariibacter amylovorans TaxID=1084520 RepID=A0ABP8G543_9BACT